MKLVELTELLWKHAKAVDEMVVGSKEGKDERIKADALVPLAKQIINAKNAEWREQKLASEGKVKTV